MRSQDEYTKMESPRVCEVRSSPKTWYNTLKGVTSIVMSIPVRPCGVYHTIPTILLQGASMTGRSHSYYQCLSTTLGFSLSLGVGSMCGGGDSRHTAVWSVILAMCSNYVLPSDVIVRGMHGMHEYTTLSIYAVEWYVWYGEHVPLAPVLPAVHLVV
jgi:hypothetical protein